MLDMAVNIAGRLIGREQPSPTVVPNQQHHRVEQSYEADIPQTPVAHYSHPHAQPNSRAKICRPEVTYANVACNPGSAHQHNASMHAYDHPVRTIEELQDRLQSSEMERREYYEERQHLIARETETKQELVESRQREAHITKECHKWRTLAETRQQELAEAQSFFASPDAITDSDIVRAVRALNAEIYQAVKRTANGCRLNGNEVHGAVRERVGGLVGSKVSELLQVYPPREDDPVVLEVALRATITTYIAEMISSWVLPSGNTNVVISSIYNRILRSESQTVAGRWRALTRKYSTSVEDRETSHVQRLLENISTILAVSRATSWDEKELQESLGIVVHAAVPIRRMVGEDVVGSEYEVFAVKRREPFDPKVMADEYAPQQNEAARSGVLVLCPSALGLRRIDREGQSGSRGLYELKVLVKPQVVLSTIVDDLGLVKHTE